MQKLFQRRVHYIILTLCFFMVCVGIVYASHVLGKMRGFIGDVVVVMLLYTLIQSLILRSRVWVAIAVTLFAFCVECAQYFDIVSLL